MAWAGIILGGGDGKRLRTLTRALTGDDRPKQFCAVVGRETLLEQTRRRARLLIPHERLLTVVTQARAVLPARPRRRRARHGRRATRGTRHGHRRSLCAAASGGVRLDERGGGAAE